MPKEQSPGKPTTAPRLAAAVVDRLTFKALIVETGSESYRLRASRAGKKPATPKPPDPERGS